MLIEIQCAKFKSNGQSRPPIKFNSGLNTILGDNVGSNSIGKSTFLMIVDFAFGGDDYVNKSKDVQNNVGRHIIQFTFKFQNQLYHFSRDTIMHNRVNKCDSEYNSLSDMSIDDFRKFLFKGYTISLQSVSFRDIITRYFRIYKRENLNENNPLHSVPQDSDENSIIALMKLFGMYTVIEELRKTLKEVEEENKIFKKSIQYGFIPKVTAKQFKENISKIQNLTKQLDKILGGKNTKNQLFFEDLATEDAKRLSLMKKELTSLRQQKSRLETKFMRIKFNLENNEKELQDDFSGLQVFFPSVNIQKIQEIEMFHRKLKNILENEFRNELQKTEAFLNRIDENIKEQQSIIDIEGIPDKMSGKTLDEYHDIKSKIEQLERQNTTYIKLQELKSTVETVTEQLKDRQAEQLRNLQDSITRKMEDLNNYIYDEQKKAPVLTLPNGKKYVFETPNDTGTGTSYKGLVVFDLSIFDMTCLPALVHDSVVLKQIADAPLEKILELYQKNGKQIFIALDKANSYPKHAQEILEQSAVLHLADKGNELFGHSWNVKEKDSV
jgi:hypothetical protein